MNETSSALTANDWLERMSQLALRHGVHLSTLQQKDGRDLELLFASVALAFPAGTGSVTLPIPNNPGLIGLVLSAQSVCFSLATPFNLVSSNGLQVTIGL